MLVRLSLLTILVCVPYQVSARVPTYINYCNHTIQADPDKNYGGLLDYEFTTEFHCHTRIEAPPGYRIFYNINHLGTCHCPLDDDCTRRLRLSSDEALPVWDTYCREDVNFYTGFIDSKSNVLDLDIKFDQVHEHHAFSVDFYIAHYGRCDADEISCGRCVHKDLACDPSKKYCQYVEEECKDSTNSFPSQNFDTNAIAGLIVAAILLGLLIFSCFRWHKQNGGNTKCFPCCAPEEELGTMSPRAREILTQQLATRGVAGSRNISFTEESERIDPSLAEPPPEYSSLENIDKKWKCYYEEEDTPPSYNDAVKNHEKYKVVGGIQHI